MAPSLRAWPSAADRHALDGSWTARALRRSVGQDSGGHVQFDLVVANGSVVDGTGAPQVGADVGIRSGRIAAVAREGRLESAQVVDASGMVVAPGFVDVDSHADWALLREDPAPALVRWLRQGVTTVVGGA